MQRKPTYISLMPVDLANEWAEQLPVAYASRFARLHTFFPQKLQQKYIDRSKEETQKFLQHVLRGEQAEVEAMIKQDPGLLLETGTVADDNGLTFHGTAFQCALRTGIDWYMWDMLLNYMQAAGIDAAPQMREFINAEEANTHPDRPAARLQKAYLEYVDKFDTWTEYKRQLAMKEIQKLELACQNLNGRYNPLPAQVAYQKYIADQESWTGKLCAEFWCHVVGFLQSRMPRVYIQQVYCHPTRSNEPTPDYEKETALPRSILLWDGRSVYSDSVGKLGLDCSLMRVGHKAGGKVMGAWRVGPTCDLAAITAVGEVGARKFNQLKERLCPAPIAAPAAPRL